MSILIVNLKHLYQRRGLWVVYLGLGFCAFAIVADIVDYPKVGEGEYVGLAALAFAVGFVVSITQIEVLTKPFSYCLVGQREVVRKVILSVAVAVNLFGSMLFVTYPGLAPLQQLAVVCSAFFAGLTLYLLGVMLGFAIRNSAGAVGLFIPFAMIGKMRFDLHVILEQAIVEYPHAVICVGILSGAVGWLWLGRADLGRRYCNVLVISIFDCWNREKLHQYNVSKKVHRLKGHPRPWVESFFLGRMDQCECFGAGRHVWGVLYNNFAMAVSQWKMFAAGLVVLTIMSGYMIHMMVFAVVVVPVAVLTHQCPPVYSNMLIFSGRRERFVSTAALCVVSVGVACAAALMMVVLSRLLVGFMPEIARRGVGRKFVFRIIDARFVLVPLVASSFFLTMRLVFYRKPVYFMLLFMLLIGPMFFALMIPPAAALRESMRAIITDRGSVAGIAVAGWAIFFLVLGYICEKRCLVGQGRSG